MLDDIRQVELQQTFKSNLQTKAVISSRQPAIIAGYSDENHRLLHSQNDTESIDTEQV